MSTIEQRLQIKREPLDKWSTREQLCLSSAVIRSGDQNWMSVSRALKPFGEPNRPADWFHQKNCAAQYGALLSGVETPKRKKRTSTAEVPLETPVETILRRLKEERLAELKVLLAEEKAEFLKLQEEMTLLQSGKVTEEQLDQWCKEIDEEDQRQEQEAIAHTQWLKEREMKKLEIEKAWRPPKQLHGFIQKRKLDNAETFEGGGGENLGGEMAKPALSPLLTSLLKSPTQGGHVSTSSILHTAITSQKTSNSSNPMIASLLNSNANVSVSPSLQNLVSSALGQNKLPEQQEQINLASDMLDDDCLPNLKIEDIASTIIVPDGPLPEIKNEEVDVIISDLIENAQDIVADPEQHLQLDGNGDININIELDEFEEDLACEEASKGEQSQANEPVDPFEFRDDLDVFKAKSPMIEDAKPSEVIKEEVEEDTKSTRTNRVNSEGSVEIVEFASTEDDDTNKSLNKSQIQDIVHSDTKPLEQVSSLKQEDIKLVEDVPVKVEDQTCDSNEQKPPETPREFSDDDMEVKIDKSGKAKRDYSRNKRKEEHDFDMLLAIEKAQLEDSDLTDDGDKNKKLKLTHKIENERSSSPWTEDEDAFHSKRRFSATGTPSDSIPNSPASSTTYCDDDKDYRQWKKSIMLVYQTLAAHKYSSLFLKPITEEHAPGYHSLIYRPMDFQTIKKNIEIGVIRTTQEFQRDFLLMLNNAIMYNKTNGTVYNMASQMQREAIESVQFLLQAQSQVDTPLRRETRTSEPGVKRKRLNEDVARPKK